MLVCFAIVPVLVRLAVMFVLVRLTAEVPVHVQLAFVNLAADVPVLMCNTVSLVFKLETPLETLVLPSIVASDPEEPLTSKFAVVLMSEPLDADMRLNDVHIKRPGPGAGDT